MTPFEWTRGRLLTKAASLFVSFLEQILKYQGPASKTAKLTFSLCPLSSDFKDPFLHSQTSIDGR